MNILFLTLSSASVKSGIYRDLMDCFVAHGHSLTAVCPTERREGQRTYVSKIGGIRTLLVRTLNVTGQCSLVEKGLGTVLLERQFIRAIKDNLRIPKADLVIYTTPPVTFTKVVEFVKRQYQASSYLLLKDIFPQNAVDLGLFSKKSIFYRFFRRKEQMLYAVSDFIGCMSEANKNYLLRENNQILENQIEVNPNSRIPRFYEKDLNIRDRYGIPKDKIVFLYGGNLGKPQGVEFLIECLQSNESRKDAFFVIAGDGQKRQEVEHYFMTEKPRNSRFIPALPHDEYESLCSSCDVGLVFLDKRFTIPNFPSRTLSYMQAGMPYIAAVDRVTDIGTIAEREGFGRNCLWGDLESFDRHVDNLINNPQSIQRMGKKSKEYFLNHFTVEHSYQTIMKHFMDESNV